MNVPARLSDVFSKKYLLIYFAVFVFPIVIATTPRIGGVLFVLLFISGLFCGWSARKELEGWELKVLLGFSVFFLLSNLSLINIDDVDEGIRRFSYILQFLLFFPMYLLFRKYSIEAGKAMTVGALFASAVMLVQAIYQVYFLKFTFAIGAYHKIIFGDVAMWCAIIIFCALISMSKNIKYYVLGALAITSALIASVLSGTRGAWIVVPIFSVWLLWRKRKDISQSFFVAIALIISVSIFAAFNIPYINQHINKAINESKAHYQDPSSLGSIGSRQQMWSDSLVIWKANPILGTGVGDFQSDRLKLFNEGLSTLPNPYRHPHSIYFDMLASAGIVGLIAMLVFMLFIPFQIFSRFYKNETDPWIKFYALAGMATIISFAVFGLTEGWLARNTLIRTYLMSILVFMSSIAVRQARNIKGIDVS